MGRFILSREAHKLDALPIGLAAGAKANSTISQGDILTYQDVELDRGSFVVKLREMQDMAMFKEIGWENNG